jgi:predicted Rossmann-fold nucleotide-binding protein
VLIGSSYWGGLVEWIRSTVLPAGMISPPDVDLLSLTDDVDEAVAIIRRTGEPAGV